MTLDARITALAQAVGADIKALSLGLPPGVITLAEPVTAFNDGSPEIIFTGTGDVVMCNAA